MNTEHISKRRRIGLLIAITASGLLLGVAGRNSMSSAASAGQAPAARQDRTDRNRQVHTLLAIQPHRAILGDDVDEPMFDEPLASSMAMHPEPGERFAPRPPCTQARACVDGRCVACRVDPDCLGGEPARRPRSHAALPGVDISITIWTQLRIGSSIFISRGGKRVR